MAQTMVHHIDPLGDPRWRELSDWHPAATIFHTPEWLETLRRTYGYQAHALTSADPGDKLVGGLVFCTVRSFLTGCRIVSLPFSDHCEPLARTEGERMPLITALERERVVRRAKFFEIRPITEVDERMAGAHEDARFCFHQLDLRPRREELFHALHRDCIQRKVRRAERERLQYESGNSESLLDQFYSLMILTRRRQGLPPQPFAWFRNLVACMGQRLTIRLVSKDGQPAASILTLQHKSTLVYKYGCSDKRLNRFGGMPFLFWRAIEEAKDRGVETFDLGRSEWDNRGLIEFKDRLGAARKELTYWRSPASHTASVSEDWLRGVTRRFFSYLPTPCLTAVGKLLYRHMG